MTDYEYWKIDGRSASVKVTVKTRNKKDETFYFSYWDEAWKWYLNHSAYYRERGERKVYLFHRKFNREWFEAEAHQIIL